jgi:lysophospholipase L1-like esterase
MRRAAFVLCCASAAALGACSNNSGPGAPIVGPTATPSPTAKPTATPAAIAYTAIGASDAVGYGASIPCANPPVVANPGCLNLTGTGYVPDIARALEAGGATVTLDDLGISGAVLGPDIRKVGNLYGSASGTTPCQPRTGSDAIPGDFITNELPSVPANSTLVTVFAGGNDTNAIANAAVCLTLGGATKAQVAAFVGAEVTAFGTDLQELLLAVKTKTGGHAKIVIADLPNFANIPYAAGGLPGLTPLPSAVRDLLQEIAVAGFDQVVYKLAATTFGVPTVDLLCNPQSYVPANFYTDGFHPNDSGYALFAKLYEAQVAAAKPTIPSFTCGETTVSTRPASGAALRPLPNLEP